MPGCAADFSCTDLITSKISSQGITYLHPPNKELESAYRLIKSKINSYIKSVAISTHLSLVVSNGYHQHVL